MKKELIEVVKQLRLISEQQETYLDKVPRDIVTVIFDNEYANLQSRISQVLFNQLFGDLADDVSWFLYEFKPGVTPGPHCIHNDKTEYTFNTDEDYYKYLESL